MREVGKPRLCFRTPKADLTINTDLLVPPSTETVTSSTGKFIVFHIIYGPSVAVSFSPSHFLGASLSTFSGVSYHEGLNTWTQKSFSFWRKMCARPDEPSHALCRYLVFTKKKCTERCQTRAGCVRHSYRSYSTCFQVQCQTR